MIKIAVFLAFAASASKAATLRSYTPGGSPCAGACTYEWARDQFQVPEGFPQRMVIPEGSIVTKMSYAKDGLPYAAKDSAVLAGDEPGEGYFFDLNGVTYMMVKLDACENWAVMIPPSLAISYAPEQEPATVLPVSYNGTPNDPGTWGCWGCGGEEEPPPACCDPPPAPVSLPLTGLLLLSGLGLIAATKTREPKKDS